MNIYNWITTVFSVTKILYFKMEEVFSFQLPLLRDPYFSHKITEVEGSCFVSAQRWRRIGYPVLWLTSNCSVRVIESSKVTKPERCLNILAGKYIYFNYWDVVLSQWHLIKYKETYLFPLIWRQPLVKSWNTAVPICSIKDTIWILVGCFSTQAIVQPWFSYGFELLSATGELVNWGSLPA